ncbi:MAG: ISKra4 family transposase, partial [Bacteroidota bacterium]
HHHQMKYSDYAECNYPIGSGVTEAACKVVVKQRLCQSGMKWKINGAHKTLMIRSLHHTDGRWQQFWRHIDDFGFSQN